MRDAVLLNAAGALVAADGIGAGAGAGPLADAFPAALKRAAAAIDTGAARDVLDRWVALSTHCALARPPNGFRPPQTACCAHLAGPAEAATSTASAKWAVTRCRAGVR